MKFPSKELLSEVLGIYVNEVKGIEANIPICGCVHSDGWYDEINIYELAHKCKEWALSKNFILHSGSTYKPERYRCDIYVGNSAIEDENFISDTEPEAIFKACEWIMEYRKCGS